MRRIEIKTTKLITKIIERLGVLGSSLGTFVYIFCGGSLFAVPLNINVFKSSKLCTSIGYL